jgi:hypothetical protein
MNLAVTTTYMIAYYYKKKYWFSVSSYLGDHFEGRFMMDHISHSANIKIRIVPLFFAMLCSADQHIPWTEQRCNCKFVLRVVIWVSSIVRPPKWSCVKAAILFHGDNFRDHRYRNLLIYRVYRFNVLSLIHMSVFNGIGMCGSALHNISKIMERFLS